MAPMSDHAHIPDAEGNERRLTRRRSLATLGGLAASALGAAAWKLETSGAYAATAGTSGLSAVSSGLVTCVLSPEMTEGPY